VAVVINVCNHGEHYETPCISLLSDTLSFVLGYYVVLNEVIVSDELGRTWKDSA